MGVLVGGWTFEWPLVGLAVAAELYLLGGRGSATRRRLREASFYSGLLVVALAIASPIDSYADSLFWVHMVQHVLLTMVAPPLLLLGRPWPRLSRPLPLRARRPLARAVLVGPSLAPVRRAVEWVGSPIQAFALFNGVLLAWHVPALFDLTLRSTAVHDLEHALFFGTALLLWTHLAPAGPRRRLSDLARAAYGTGAILVSWALAVVLGFASSPLYQPYADLAHRPGGLSALADQQLAAGIMWVPASVPFTIAVFVAAYRWLGPAKASALPDLRPRET
ncbi:MAG: cytochrome c oxidase assembly protein [Gaiellaceae bacterium]